MLESKMIRNNFNNGCKIVEKKKHKFARFINEKCLLFFSFFFFGWGGGWGGVEVIWSSQ
jgi:hypothetical protein